MLVLECQLSEHSCPFFFGRFFFLSFFLGGVVSLLTFFIYKVQVW